MAYGPRNQGLGETEVADRVRESLELLHIGHLADRSPFDLSGGQQRLAAIAGVLAMEPECIVLDEATAFADPENEHKIQMAFERLTKGKTVLMIAHRLPTIQNADEILVLEQGTVAEQGDHDALMAQNGIYASMWRDYQTSIAWNIGKTC